MNLYKDGPGATQFQGAQYMYQGGYGAPADGGYYGQGGQPPMQPMGQPPMQPMGMPPGGLPQGPRGQPEGMNPSKLLAQTLYQGEVMPLQGLQGPPGGPESQQMQAQQLQALHRQLQQIGAAQGPPQGAPVSLGQVPQVSQVPQGPQVPQVPQGQPPFGSLPIPVDASVESSPHWQHQVQLAQVSRGSNMPHFYARNAASMSRGLPGAVDTSPRMGSTLVEMTKSVLSSVAQEDETNSTNNNEHRRPVQEPLVDEEEEDQRIRIRQNNTQLWTGLDLCGQQLSTIAPRLFNYQFLRRLFLNGNRLTAIPASIAKLKSLRVLDLSANLLTSVPAELGMLFNLKYLFLFDNNLESLPWQFGNLESLEFLGVEGNQGLDPAVVSTISKKGTRGLIIHLRDDAPKLTPPQPRKWIPVGEDGEPQPEEAKPASEVDLQDTSASSFTLMSYNTLCQHYATQRMYRYTPSWALAWEYRLKKLTEEISLYKPQVICLQEVETKTYEEYWLPLLEKQGYKGIFHCKGRAKTMSEKNAKKVDGCATFFKTDVFQLVDKKQIDYSSVAMTQDKFKKTEDLFNRFANKDNVALVVVLQHLGSGSKVVVANTHLHWDPAFNDVKTMQVAVLLDELQVVVKKHTGSRDDLNKLPLVICGDFNSQRDSAVYQLISQGVSKKHADMAGHDYGRFTSDGFSHPFNLSSAYDCVGELPFTNFTPTFTEVIDYIWYSTQPLSVRGLLGEADREYTKQVIGFPTADCPSDHIPLIAKFDVRRRKYTRKT